MKAAVWYGKHDIRIENIEEPKIEPGKIKIKVAWTGICGSDLHAYHGAPGVVQVGVPHPVTGAMAPLTLGQEFAGVIHEVGETFATLRISLSAQTCHQADRTDSNLLLLYSRYPLGFL